MGGKKPDARNKASSAGGDMGNTLKPRLEHAEKTGVLTLTKIQLKDFPEPEILLVAAKLRSLDISFNKLRIIPDSIEQLKSLKILNLSHNKINKLPESFCLLAKLEMLNVSHNSLQALPAEFSKLTALKTLNVSENQLKVFPEQLAHLPNLEVADLSNNKISEMKDTPAIGKLTCSELILNVNQLAALPTNLSRCSRLKILRVQENCLPLDGIPSSLLSDSKVHALSVEGNLFEERDLHQVSGWDDYQERYTASKKKMY